MYISSHADPVDSAHSGTPTHHGNIARLIPVMNPSTCAPQLPHGSRWIFTRNLAHLIRSMGVMSFLGSLVLGGCAQRSQSLPQRIAYIDPQALMEDFVEARRAREAFEAERVLYLQAIQTFEDSIRRQADSLARVLGAEAPEVRLGLEEGSQLAARMRENAEARLQQSNQDRSEAVMRKIRRQTENHAREQGYTYVFTYQPEQVLYARRDEDITQSLLRELNALYGNPTGSEPLPPAIAPKGKP